MTGEIVMVGGAVMLLVIGNRQTTKDIDAYFATNPQAIRDAALSVAKQKRLSPNWLNDTVKGFFHTQPPTTLWLDVPGLRVCRRSSLRPCHEGCRWTPRGHTRY